MPPDSPTALLSLSDRTGLDQLACALAARGYRMLASAGTAQALAGLGYECTQIETLTGFPPLLGGRVKTLHPKVFGGILARADVASDAAELERFAIPRISVVAVNLYPFARAAADARASESEVIEEIDIGGVSLVRAAAKNYRDVSVLPDPSVYPEFIAALARGGPSLGERRAWAARAFTLVAVYDAAIAAYVAEPSRQGLLPGVLRVELPLRSRLRYGENPWSQAAFYDADPRGLVARHAGKTLSFNNMLDVDSCLRLIAPIEEPKGFAAGAVAAAPVVAAIVKHTIPCGLAAAGDAASALQAALGADPISAFGGIVTLNAPLERAGALVLKPRFLEVVAAPAFHPDALEVLAGKKNLRVLTFDPQLPARLRAGMTLRSALGGVLMEQPDPAVPPDEWKVVTSKEPDAAAWRDLLFAFGAVRQVKSNAAVVAHDQVTLGICGGQTNRVAAVELACRRAGSGARGAVLATDGYFPFADGIEAAIAAGIRAIVAPSGSIRDGEVIQAAQRGAAALVFASRRYFLH